MGRTPLIARGIIPPSVWCLRLLDAHDRVVQAIGGGNDILTAGQRDAIQMLVGLASPGVFQWVELGSSSLKTDPTTMTGCQQPLLLPGSSTPYRAQGTWTPSGSDATLDVSVPGSAITGSVRELALYPARVGADALFRFVTPSVIQLGSLNTLSISVLLSV